MRPRPARSAHNRTDPRNVAGNFAVPDPAPTPLPPPVNANVIAVILTAGGDVLLMFDRPVNVDHANPPATWTFGASGLQAGGMDFTSATEVVPSGTVSVGDTATIGDSDPAARTPDGGYVNGISTGISAG